ncbi:retrovirus-related pol polyprotein from transposon TNT 1-94 [Tanacetum coccineum]
MLMNLRIFFIINELQAPLEAKNVLIGKLKEHIANLKGKITVKSVQNVHNSNVVTSNVYKLDLPPLSPCINNNMATHVDYLKHTQANTDILREIIEDAKELRPLKSNLASTCKFVTRIQELLVYVNATCPSTKHLGNVTISQVYYVKGLGHNLFSVGLFCDSDLEDAFRKHTCYVWNLDGADLLYGSRDKNLYTISMDDLLKTLNQLDKQGLVRSLPKLKFKKDHICSACSLGKSKKSSHKPKADDTNQEKLFLLHMDLCGPIRVESINGKKYILVIVDDYSRFTWVKFFESKDPIHIKCFEANRSSMNTLYSIVVERRNRTLVEAARTMLIFSKAPLFLWAKAVNTACYTQNKSLIRLRYNKTPYEVMHDKKPDLSYLHVFGSLCYPTNDSKNLAKLKAKADIGIFIGYAPEKKAFRIYNKRTRLIMETYHVTFDELTAMASE